VSDRQASAEVRGALAEAHRRQWAFVLAATVRLAGDLDVAEECVQDAFVAALTTWTQRGIPANPGAWLTATARRRVLDALRRAQTLRRKLPLLVGTDPATSDPFEWAGEGEEADMSQLPDDRLQLLFTCCHPALAPEAQVALTLRLVCGLTCGCQIFGSPHATCAYSWISPPRRSRRMILPDGVRTAGSPGASGGVCPNPRWGRWPL
jgi:predicted RNA polymerase sigma factor